MRHDRLTSFRRLHEADCFVMPNPWDVGSARLLAQLGFPALATTSSGFAWSHGLPDGKPSLEQTLEHLRTMSAAVDVPLNGDFLDGFAKDPADLADTVARAVATGVAGISIEDGTGRISEPLYAFEEAVERVRAARTAIDASGTGVVFTARSEGFIVGRPDLKETIRRLTAYAEAGADCLYAPGVRSIDDLRAIVSAVAPKPVNALVGADFTTVGELASLGVRRISVGGALARVAWGAFLSAAREIVERGSFDGLGRAIPPGALDAAFASRDWD
jgi:2-methylisocitrate lyase-like PEP mutase family enzyme